MNRGKEGFLDQTKLTKWNEEKLQDRGMQRNLQD